MPAVQATSSGPSGRMQPSSSHGAARVDRSAGSKSVHNGNQMEYSVVFCSSEDPDHPASELLVHSSNTSGWQSGRFCDFPQDVTIHFEQPVHLSQIQFLSHQSKISSKLELFTAVPDPTVQSHVDAKFTRLGYLSLDSNERSQFQARELKSVYVDVPVSYVKILLHKCYVNKFNLVNQVGLVALNCIGRLMTDSELDHFHRRSPPQTRLVGVNNGSESQVAQSSEQSYAKATNGPQEALLGSSAISDGVLTADHYEFDKQTVDQIQRLFAAKQRAVEFEDYEEAKRCKDMVDRLRLAGAALKQLEDRKQRAVLHEDFDEAKAIKIEMDRLRSSVDVSTPIGTLLQSGVPNGDSAQEESRYVHDGIHSQPHDNRVVLEREPVHRTPRAAVPQDSMVSVRPAEQEGASVASRIVHSKAAVQMDTPLNVDDLPATASGGYNYVPAGLQEYPPGQDPPELSTNHDSVAARNDGTLTKNGEILAEYGNSDHPLSGIQTNILELEQPEFLSASHAKEATLVVHVFGEYLARCLWSKSWNLRDAALQKIQLELDQGNHEQSFRQLVQVMSIVLKRGVGDKIANIFLTSSLLLQHCVGTIFVHEDVSRSDVQAALDPVVPLVVARLSDSHPKIRGAVGESLMGLCRCRSIGSQYILQFVLRLPKKKNPNARLVCCRIYFLAALVEEQGLQPSGAPKDSPGVPLEPIIEIACEHVEHPAQNVRGAIVALMSSCYHLVGYRRIEPLLVNLRPAQRDVFEKAFEDKGCQAPRDGLGKQDYMFELSQQQIFDDGSKYESQPSSPTGYGERPAVSETPGELTPVPPVNLSGSVHDGMHSQRSSRVVTGRDHDVEDAQDFQASEGPPFTCVFCQEQDPAFTPEGLDVHYWQQCPMLMECQGCSQVVEIRWLEEHRRDECDAQVEDSKLQIPDSQCPLCEEFICELDDPSSDQLWRDHLTSQCPNNSRLAVQS